MNLSLSETPSGEAHIAHVQMPLINAHVEVSSEARGLNFDLSIHLHPYIVYVSTSSDSSGESVHMHRLAELSLFADMISTKILCNGPCYNIHCNDKKRIIIFTRNILKKWSEQSKQNLW